MEEINCFIEPTAEQLCALAGPKTITSLLAADFLGRQKYIDDWIHHWTQRTDILPVELPLCVVESIRCDKKLTSHYHKYVKAAIVDNDDKWLSNHYILNYKRAWNYAMFETMTMKIFHILWASRPCDFNLISFVASVQRLDIWIPFVQLYGPTECLSTVLKQGWTEGAEHCLSMGADLEGYDFIYDAIRADPSIFKAIADCNPPATLKAYNEFKLQVCLRRIRDVPLVEEFFWIRGFKEEV